MNNRHTDPWRKYRAQDDLAVTAMVWIIMGTLALVIVGLLELAAR